MSKGINLLPDVTLKEEKEKKQQKLLTIISLSILVAGSLALIAVFTIDITLKRDYNSIVDQNNELTSKVVNYADTEITQRGIKAKLTTAGNVLAAAKDYKSIIENIQNLVPETGGIIISDINLDKANKVIINGKANNAENFRDYVNNILSEEKGMRYFTDVTLGSLSTTKEAGVQFNLTMSLVKTEAAK